MNFSSLKHVNLAIFLAVSFTPHPSYAENSGWMKISKIKSYGRYLKRNHLIPFDIKCKRPNLAGGWTSGLFKVKTRSQLPDNVQKWRISTTGNTYHKSIDKIPKGGHLA